MAYSPSYIQESAHGGHNCGVTHIFNFIHSTGEDGPGLMLQPRFKKSAIQHSAWIASWPHLGLVVNDEYPAQSAGDRLKMMIERIEKGVPDQRIGRPQGVIEITLIEDQLDYWREFIEALGFKEVSKNKNSNSSNTIYFFHRYSGSI